MKKALLLIFALVATSMALGQENFKAADPYFQPNEMPDMCNWLAGPPAEGSAEFAYDVARYEWGKQVRRDDTARLELAKKQADGGVLNFCEEFSVPFGMTISKDTTPEIFKLILNSVSTCATATHSAKDRYMRKRPYVHFGEGTPLPQFEKMMGVNGSYPSGHTTRGWAAALILMEINPAATDALLQMGYMQGDSRIILGYHWQSDVTAARLVASAAVARLHTSKEFMRQMRKAKREFRRLSRK